MTMPNSWDSLGFEQHVQSIFRGNGYEITPNDRQNELGYDFISQKNGKRYAVQVKAWKKKVPANTVGRFLEFCDESDFERGIIVSLNGFTEPSHALALTDGKKKLFLGEYDSNNNTIKFSSTDLNGITVAPSPPEPVAEPVKISIFTAKGGVGKTTVSAHLAGALALGGKDVALLDIDPECNLHLLTRTGNLTIPNQKNGHSHEISVIKGHEWSGKEGKRHDIIIADCSPAFALNPEKVMRETDIFICPVMLSPLSIGHNAEVLNRSYQQIRAINKQAKVFVLINAFKPDMSTVAVKLLVAIKTLLQKIINDPNFQLIYPEIVAIRESALLKNFGENPKLEFLNVCGRCYPRQDFLALADYLLENEHLTTNN
jgi:cellulose biosynthesis protein BcsQ